MAIRSELPEAEPFSMPPRRADFPLRPSPRSVAMKGPDFSLLKQLSFNLEVKKVFAEVVSSKCAASKYTHRADFLKRVKKGRYPLNPVIISQSEFVPSALTAHLMTNKKDSALGVKYISGDKITLMEGAMHTFITPICPITMTGDYAYQKGHSVISLNGKGRNVILSASIQPDFEKSGENEVMMRVVEVKEEPLDGEELPTEFRTLWERLGNNAQRQLREYDNSLQKHVVWHLTSKHRLPSLKEIGEIEQPAEAIQLLEGYIKDRNVDEVASLINKFVKLNDHVISLEALFSVYIHQVRNEFSVLETLLPQGYVYTIDPPSIFAKQIGTSNVTLLNRLQILALKYLQKKSPFSNLKIIGFNDYADKGAIELFKSIFPDKQVCPKQSLFKDGPYSVKESYALVIHNNSDAFGQNIETEDLSSMDGVIGSYSDAACQLLRQRKDLLANLC